MVDGEINLGIENQFHQMLMGIKRTEMASINPQIENLSSHPLCNTKTDFHPWKDEGIAEKRERKMPN